jgi:hypothetical protein
MRLKFDPKYHKYWKDGRQQKGASSVAKIPDDMYKINQWRLRMVTIGMALSPALVERAAAHYDDRDQLETIAEEAIKLAKGHEASARGIAAHRITERIDLGQDIIDSPLAQAIRGAWSRALDDAGLEVIPQFIERIVLYPDLNIAGMFDRICRRRSDGALVVVDAKTGENVLAYPHANTIQVAIYAYAPLLAGPIPKSGGSTEQFEPMPDVDKEIGYIVHMPSEAEAQVLEVDIAAGWQAFNDICLPALDWRNRKGMIRQMISAAVWNPQPRLVAVDGTVEPKDPPPAAPVPSPTAQVNWLLAWIHKIRDNGHLDDLAALWPTGVPLPKHSRQWNEDHIDLITTACAQVDAKYQTQLYPPDPTTPTPTGIQTRS